MGLRSQLQELLTRVSKVPLRPQQRLVILRFHLHSRLYHRLVLAPWTDALPKKMDAIIRRSVRRWMNLPRNTTLVFFHAPVTEGGLVITSLRASTPSMLLRRLSALPLSHHSGCEAALQTPLLTSLQRRAAAATNYQDRDRTTKVEVHRMWAMLVHRSCDGKALKESRKVPAAYR
ncbi:hypothetical protein IscW_ISCW003936 [Ixodes scapularis]|uniref:Uncharacterized protein n=1 Tax=Ixodes scapularis TaxID=6945 RepID=B7PIQ4_IXOSC|nr:hypothetical protein IscW_ISCW003936 [Ixodes scapularis]|eukprot:XP_002405803.1 hypothetical protein IscW_ISCW003936 [Ixodes scapularis]